MLPDMPRDQRLDLLRKMLMIRRAEEHVVRFNEEHEGLIRGHFHIYIGQEATGVGVCAALAPEDYVFSTHRNHGHVIAKGGDPGKVLAEVIGRETGYCLGRGGTFHVAAPDLNMPHTSASSAAAPRWPRARRWRRRCWSPAPSPWSSSATAPWTRACSTRA